jgi:7-dehydrocholesterol reductase
MTYDRAGYYLCWGGIVWMPTLFPLSQIYMSKYHSTLSSGGALIILAIGIVATIIEYRIDREKEVFVAWRQKYVQNLAEPYELWGKKVEFLDVTYTDANGEKVKSALLTSGYWGKARHLNYTFELICCLTCCVTAGFGQSWFLPLLYFYFIAALIPHRILRDEEKCRKKYGQFWDVYCKKVPYRLIPHVI